MNNPKESPSVIKHVKFNMTNRNSSQGHSTKDKLLRKNTIDVSSPNKKSFDFSAVANDILNSKGNSIKSKINSNAKNQIKNVIKK